MPRLRVRSLSVLSMALFTASLLSAGESSIQWQVQPLLAGKVSLQNEAYQIIRPLGATRTSPDLQLPLQLVYDSQSSVLGLPGHGWRIPQLESSAVPVDKDMDWTTPWGEVIRFFPKTKPTEDMLAVFADDMKGKAGHFAPYSEWEADGQDGKWTITGKGAKKGWRFEYDEAKLQKIAAPSGFALEFRYDKDGRPIRVVQEGRAFAELDYDRRGVLASLRLNEVPFAFTTERAKAVKLPDVPAAKPATLERIHLKAYQIGTLAPVAFDYNEGGFLVAQRQGDFVDALTVDAETPEARAKHLAAVAAYEAKRKKGEKADAPKREHVHGRLLADGQFAYRYPGKNRVELKDKADRAASFAYDTGRGVMSLTDFVGKKSTIYYFMRHDVAYNGRIRQVVDGRDRVVASYRYDKDTGNITRIRDMADNEILLSYTESGDLARVEKRGADETDAAPVAAFAHDKQGRLTEIARLDAAGRPARTTTLAYTSKNLPSRIDDGRGAVTVKYNDFGFPVSVTNAFGQTSTMAYSRLNRPESVAAHDGKTTVYTYDNNGLMAKVENFADAAKTRLMSSLAVEYGADGLPMAYTDHRGRRKAFERDGFGRVAKEFFPDETQVAYAYDALGQLRAVLDQNRHEIKFDWNQFGLASRTTPADQVNVYDYDQFGLLKKVESKFADAPKGARADRVIAYEHDALDRVTKVVYDGVRSESMEYDTWGRVVKATQEDGVARTRRVATMKYDHFGRLAEKTETTYEGNVATEVTTQRYKYNPWGQRTERFIDQHKPGEWDDFETKAIWTYDDHGCLTAMTEGKDHVTYEYDADHRVKVRTANGTPVYYTYTAEGWLQTKSMGAPLGEVATTLALANIQTPAAWLRYEYDADGRIAAREVNGRRQRYEYDAKDQLAAVLDDQGQELERYHYDPAGNIRRKRVNGVHTAYAYDAANQLVTSTDHEGRVTPFAYDAAGRMVKEGGKEYRYGFLDKVLEIEEAGETLHAYQYWTNGQIAKAKHAIHDKYDTFLWDNLALIKRNAVQFVNEPHITGGNPVLAQGNPLLEDIRGNTIFLLGADVSNGPHSPMPQESIISKTSIDQSCDFYTGKPRVSGLGYVFLYRNFRQEYSKWLSSDPLGYPDGWNNYSYCNNQFTESVDSKGLNASSIAVSYAILYLKRAAAAIGNPGAALLNHLTSNFSISADAIDILAATLLKNNTEINHRIDQYVNNNMKYFDKNTALGEYALAPSIELVRLNLDAAWGAVIGTSVLEISGTAHVMQDEAGAKSVGFVLQCNYFDPIDANSFTELYNKGYFADDAGFFTGILGLLEGLVDIGADNIMGAAFNMNPTWQTSRIIKLE